jgi:hypothetical protein
VHERCARLAREGEAYLLALLLWGPGTEFGVMPIIDGRTYWYAAANAAEGQRNPGELGELSRRFGSWHDPIPAVLARGRHRRANGRPARRSLDTARAPSWRPRFWC